MTARPLRVLIVSHGHPNWSFGGAEVASYNLHKGLNAVGGVESHFLARVGAGVPRHEASALMSLGTGGNEILYHADRYDHFMLSNAATDEIDSDLVRYVETIEPDIVHFHHVIGLGLETIYAIRRALPEARLVLTFHEYLSLCHHHGQMIKKTTGALCSRATPVDCHQCFPDISPSRFLRRDSFIRAMVGLCDAYVSPSRFLADRYAAWGLDGERMNVVENGLDIAAKAPPRRLATGGRRSRFAFFGQMIEFKGVDVLLEAVERVPEKVWADDARAMIFGGPLDRAPEVYRTKLEQLVTDADGRARLYGPYRNADMPGLMESADWVVVPSTWWENSPVVIQEAFFHGRPVITANIGGMAEKVRDGIDGLHFRARSAEDLADRLAEALTEPGLWERLRAGIPEPMTHTACAAHHVALYEDVLARRRPLSIQPEKNAPETLLRERRI